MQEPTPETAPMTAPEIEAAIRSQLADIEVRLDKLKTEIADKRALRADLTTDAKTLRSMLPRQRKLTTSGD